MSTISDYKVDRFADIEILRYEVTGFEELSLKQQTFIYHLSEAAQCGRDILFDQNYKYNLLVRTTLEEIYTQYKGDRRCNEFLSFETYLKQIWFSNGIHHHYSTQKIVAQFTPEYFLHLLTETGSKADQDLLLTVIFNQDIDAKRVDLSDEGDMVVNSANNYYEGVTQAEAEAFYAAMNPDNKPKTISYGLNSRLEKINGKLIENIWKVGGLYSKTIVQIIKHLNCSISFCENEEQATYIKKLISFYETGDLENFDDYSILWVKETNSQVDFLNGFIETYGDSLGRKASWESTVNFTNKKASERTKVVSEQAKWFEKNSPVEDRFKKKNISGVSAKVITNAMLGGDCYPATPIGINLPNSNWIREVHGSKSVTIENIIQAYDKASQGGNFAKEFYHDAKDLQRNETYGFITDTLHTDLHECLGHGSGQLLEGVSAEALKSYGATIEEARADLFGLYYIADPKMVELGVLPNMEAYKAGYYKFLLNGLMTQLVRINIGDELEESHMRDRQLIAAWVLNEGKKSSAVELKKIDGKTQLFIYNYEILRQLFGELLAKVQAIKSKGDFESAKRLVNQFGVKIDQELHIEIIKRYAKLNIAPYRGFVNPVYKIEKNKAGLITKVNPTYDENYTEQMLRYSKIYSF